mgnify:CR=1 FL=1
MGLGLSFWQNIDYGTVKFDINHNVWRQQQTKRTTEMATKLCVLYSISQKSLPHKIIES